MGIAAYNRASKVLSARLDMEAEERRFTATNQRCLCGASKPDGWTAGVHHGLKRCARVITRIAPRSKS